MPDDLSLSLEATVSIVRLIGNLLSGLEPLLVLS